MRLIQLLTARFRLKLVRYCFKAGKWFAMMGERLRRF